MRETVRERHAHCLETNSSTTVIYWRVTASTHRHTIFIILSIGLKKSKKWRGRARARVPGGVPPPGPVAGGSAPRCPATREPRRGAHVTSVKVKRAAAGAVSLPTCNPPCNQSTSNHHCSKCTNTGPRAFTQSTARICMVPSPCSLGRSPPDSRPPRAPPATGPRRRRGPCRTRCPCRAPPPG